METHKMLKEIADKIGYESEFKYKSEGFNSGLIVGFVRQVGYEEFIVDEREIIFTQEFMNKYTFTLTEKLGIDEHKAVELENKILDNLDNPTLYLYNLLELGEK